MKKYWKRISSVFAVAAVVGAQTPAAGPVNRSAQSQQQQGPVSGMGRQGGFNTQTLSAAPNYVLGSDDQILIRAYEVEEISEKVISIGGDGFISLPLIGRVHAQGLTVLQLEAELKTKLSRFVNNPEVTVMVAEFRSQPVSVLGAVISTGQVQLRGQKTLMEVISLAGGTRTDAGSTVMITRQASEGPLPIPGASSTGNYSTGSVNLRSIMNGRAPEQNIVIKPDDVITVAKAPLIYVLGEVGRPGGYVLDDHDSLSSLQCLSLAGGLNKTAAPKKAKILRLEDGSSERKEIDTNISKIMEGKSPDVSLRADDILFIPNNLPKTAALRAAESAVQIGTGLAIWRF